MHFARMPADNQVAKEYQLHTDNDLFTSVAVNRS